MAQETNSEQCISSKETFLTIYISKRQVSVSVGV